MSDRMPYFDYLLAAFEKGHESLEKSFGHHVHWGYWEFPDQAQQTLEDFSVATESLSQLIYHAAQVTDSQAVLDVGCGFGGTISSLNNQYQTMKLTGINIDERQILRARQQISPQGANEISFQQGDACALPFADNSFDVVLAVECIFHFSSRKQFFKEVNRVLKPGGYLALSDFLLNKRLSKFYNSSLSKKLTHGFFGSCNVDYSKEDYYKLAHENNLCAEFEKNITKNTLPTYTYLKSLINTAVFSLKDKLKAAGIILTIICIESLSKMGLLEYFVFSFRKPL